MIRWFKKLSKGQKISVIIPIAVAIIGGLFGLLKTNNSSTQQNTFQQTGQRSITVVAKDNNGNMAGGDINFGINGNAALDQLVNVSKEAGQSKNEIKHLEEKNRQQAGILGVV